MLNNFANWRLRKKYFLLSKMQNKFKFLNFCILKRKPCMNLNLFCIFDKRKYFLRKLQLAKLFSIKFSADSCYFFTILPQKIQKSLIITTKTCTRIQISKAIISKTTTIQRLIKKWSIFCFYGIFWIVVFEITAFEFVTSSSL